MIRRRGLEEIGLSFLDVICCGFGAIILLLMIVKTVEPILIEDPTITREGLVQKREQLNEILGETRILKRQLTDEERQLTRELVELAKVERDINDVLGRYRATAEEAEFQQSKRERLVQAKQSLTAEMERLLGLDFVRATNTIGGVTVDSEYIIFVIDTSGSMQQWAWGGVQRKVREALDIYPQVKGIQVMNDMGDYMFPDYAGRWIPDTPGRRRDMLRILGGWAPNSNSSPVEGIQQAINTFYAPDRKISIYVFGDDFSKKSIERVVDTVDQVNRIVEDGSRRVRIHAVGFPVRVGAASGNRFAALMRELTFRNDGTFVGLSTLE
ncbi:MAG: VWA domain-containing protein [Gammaproteobacteria bacterium]|nr:VWA domain-containing protein [Gammaproteobacteria bacterium]MDE0192700.1 VWA domain-containing protein [Gammaproteobacteria bacterium]